MRIEIKQNITNHYQHKHKLSSGLKTSLRYYLNVTRSVPKHGEGSEASLQMVGLGAAIREGGAGSTWLARR
ncbi:hypothetical protein OFM39_25055, partial [Escherichia coli]|nr:hypothetical protein [Escherichia coli]